MIYVLSKERLSEDLITEDFEYIDSFTPVLNWLEFRQPDPVCVDTETRGLDFTRDEMVMFQIGDMDHQYLIDTRYYDVGCFKKYLESKELLKVLHNAKFDYKMIRRWSSGDIQMENVFDTMLAEKVLTCGNTHKRSSLQAVVGKYLDEYLEKDEQTSFITHSGPFTVDQIIYGAMDITKPLQVMEYQKESLKEEGLLNLMKLENKAVLAFADIEYNGIGIDEKAWLANAEISKREIAELTEKLNAYVETEEELQGFQSATKQLDFFIPEEDISFVNINWDSPKQVLKIFRTYVPDLPSVGKDVLGALEHKPQIVLDYMLYKKKTKLYNSYGPSMLELRGADGLLHTSFSQILQTGRVSSSRPNMQQIPADNRYRNCFVTEKGWSFVSSDFSSQELCVIATIANDPVWIKALEQGKDLHSVCAALVYGYKWEDAQAEGCAFYKEGPDGEPEMKKCDCPKHKKLRTGVKSINFGLAYGMSEYALSDTLQISVDEARELIKTYFSTFPKIKAALERFGEFGKRNGYIMTMPPFKRKRFFPMHEYIETQKGVAGSIERASKNTPIQGSSADMTKLAMVYVRNFIKKHQVPVKMVMAVHDQIDTVARDDYAEQWKVELNGLMERAALKIITNGLLKAETEVSPVWKK